MDSVTVSARATRQLSCSRVMRVMPEGQVPALKLYRSWDCANWPVSGPSSSGVDGGRCCFGNAHLAMFDLISPFNKALHNAKYPYSSGVVVNPRWCPHRDHFWWTVSLVLHMLSISQRSHICITAHRCSSLRWWGSHRGTRERHREGRCDFISR
jgi:hypothetical protein